MTGSINFISSEATAFFVQKALEVFDNGMSHLGFGETACFRGGCLTGLNHLGTQVHGFLVDLMKCAVIGTTYTVYGCKGKHVCSNSKFSSPTRIGRLKYSVPQILRKITHLIETIRKTRHYYHDDQCREA